LVPKPPKPTARLVLLLSPKVLNMSVFDRFELGIMIAVSFIASAVVIMDLFIWRP
jgi:hypothetical protein